MDRAQALCFYGERWNGQPPWAPFIPAIGPRRSPPETPDTRRSRNMDFSVVESQLCSPLDGRVSKSEPRDVGALFAASQPSNQRTKHETPYEAVWTHIVG